MHLETGRISRPCAGVLTGCAALVFIACGEDIQSTSRDAGIDAGDELPLQPAVPDPLVHDYIMGHSAELVTSWSGIDSGQLHRAVYDPTGFGIPELSDEMIQTAELARPAASAGEVDTVAADLDASGQDEVITVVESDAGSELVIASVSPEDLTLEDRGSLALPDAISAPRVGAGNLDSDPAQELFVSGRTLDGEVVLVIVDAADLDNPRILAELDPGARTVASQTMLDSRWSDLAVADFDGDGYAEAVVVASGPDRNILLRSYDLQPGVDGTPPQLAPRGQFSTTWTDGLDTLADPEDYDLVRLAVSAGDFDDDHPEELALAWQIAADEESHGFLQIVSMSADLMSIEEGPPTEQGSSLDSGGFPLAIEVEDFDGDGRDDCLSAMYGSARLFHVAPVAEEDGVILTLVAGATLPLVASPSLSSRSDRRFLAVADADGESSYEEDGPPALLEVAVLGIAEVEIEGGDIAKRMSVTAYRYAPETGSFDLVTSSDVGDFDDPPPMALAAGDFDGDALRLGKPVLSRTVSALEPLVILNAPPTHFDLVPGAGCPEELCDINRCYGDEACAFSASHEVSVSQRIEFSTGFNSEWIISSGSVSPAASNIPIASVEKKLEAKMGRHFSRSSHYRWSFTVENRQDAVVDDFIYAAVVDYDVWEYPIYESQELQGYVMVLVPTLRQRRWFDSKSFTARDYQPSHEAGNILSYRDIIGLADSPEIAEAVRVVEADARTLGGFAGSSWSMTEEGTEVDQVSYRSSESAPAWMRGAFDPGMTALEEVAGRILGDYSEETISTHGSSVEDRQGLSVEFGTVDLGIGNVRYTVTPFVYWREEGTMVLDYAVAPELAPAGWPETFWDEHYQGADLTMVLPWRLDAAKGIALSEPEQVSQSRDVRFQPPFGVLGQEVTIEAVVRNFGLEDTAAPATVRFYLGDPDRDGELLADGAGQTEFQTEDAVASRSSAVASMSWLIPEDFPSRFVRVYAVLDPDDDQAELVETNNLGWNVLSISPE